MLWWGRKSGENQRSKKNEIGGSVSAPAHEFKMAQENLVSIRKDRPCTVG